jgi:5-methylcytosine-specific restriction endonuclease McrA
MARYSAEVLRWIYDRWHDGRTGRCAYCGKAIAFANYAAACKRGAWVVDHGIPRGRGGPDHPENWWPACITCDLLKGLQTPEEYCRVVGCETSSP